VIPRANLSALETSITHMVYKYPVYFIIKAAANHHADTSDPSMDLSDTLDPSTDPSDTSDPSTDPSDTSDDPSDTLYPSITSRQRQ